MHPLIKEIRGEHQELLVELKRIEELCFNGSIWSYAFLQELEPQIKRVTQFVEHQHHEKEEKQLFPLLKEATMVQQGGPNCTYFYHFHLEYNYYGQSLEFLKELELEEPDHHVSTELQKILADGSALRIPMEEHWAGHNFVFIINKLLFELRAKAPAVTDPSLQEPVGDHERVVFLKRIIGTYISLLRGHIAKEDDCLLLLADQVLLAQV